MYSDNYPLVTWEQTKRTKTQRKNNTRAQQNGCQTMRLVRKRGGHNGISLRTPTQNTQKTQMFTENTNFNVVAEVRQFWSTRNWDECCSGKERVRDVFRFPVRSRLRCPLKAPSFVSDPFTPPAAFPDSKRRKRFWRGPTRQHIVYMMLCAISFCVTESSYGRFQLWTYVIRRLWDKKQMYFGPNCRILTNDFPTTHPSCVRDMIGS